MARHSGSRSAQSAQVSIIIYVYEYILYISFYAYYAHLPSAGSPPLCTSMSGYTALTKHAARWIKDKEYTLAHFVVCFLCHRHTKRSKKASSQPIIIGGSAALGRVSDLPNATRSAWRNLKFVFTYREYIYKVYLIIIDCRISLINRVEGTAIWHAQINFVCKSFQFMFDLEFVWALLAPNCSQSGR